MWVWTGVDALQNKRVSPSGPFCAEHRNAVLIVSCPPRPRHTHLRTSHAMGCDSAGSLPPFSRRARILPHLPRAALSRVITRALRARVRHFSFFAFTASPLCRKPLSDSRFGVKAFPKMLHRGEASIPPPPSGCNRPRRARPTRLGWGTRITKSPLQNAEKRGQLHHSPRPRW